MFWLIYVAVNIQNVLLWLECRHGDVYTPLINAIVNNALLHCNARISQIIHILRFCPVESLPQIV